MNTWLSALVGGLLIGFAAAILWRGYGRIMGCSGILAGLFRGEAWRMAFVAGVLVSPWLYKIWFGIPEVVVTNQPARLVLGGLLVGYGVRLGSGCTSGHGVCGLGRLSKRSAVAVGVFMLFGFLTVFILKHMVGIV
ncbi:YeeE/YedE family protein [Neisseria sp. S1]|uniref:YeeE/YedE family protein n=1 Tax=Neisseria sp. S1 TaxID=3318354 RepID=UPI003A8C778A